MNVDEQQPADLPWGSAVSDGDLIRQFAAHRDQEAFEELVGRHGSMVLGVCRRILRHEQDVEDAFQATFLVLARRAAQVRWQASLANWLYGVACRTALKARSRRARSPESPLRNPEMIAADDPSRPSHAPPSPESLRLLDEHLHSLPDRYRAPLVLCYLQGKTRDEAAEALGLSVGAVKGRLERGREKLRKRLTKAGLTLPAALPLLADALGESIAVPKPLAAATVDAALTYAGGHLTGAALSPQAITLAQGELTMFKTLTVLKYLAAALLVSGAIGGGLIAAFPDDPLDAEDRTVRVAQADPNSDKESIQGTWKIVEHWIHGRSVGNEPNPGGEVAADKVVIDDKTFRIRFSDGTEFVMPYTLDPSRTPAAIDVEFPEAEGPRPGIYELRGGKLRIRWSTTTKANPRRPTKFLAAGDPPNDEFTYLVLQRENRETDDKAAEAPKVSPDQAAGTELEKLIQERQEVLKAAVDAALARYKMAGIDYTTVLEVQRDLIQAQLEQATTREQKIALYKQLVQNLEKVEEVADVRRQAGEGSQLDRLKARAARLQAQIDLVRAQSSPED